MKNRFTLFRRNSVFYCEDAVTGKQTSLRTKDEEEARALLHAKNETHRQPALNRRMAQTYLSAVDPAATTRTWQTVMDECVRTKHGNTRARCRYAVSDAAFASITTLKLVETQPAHLLHVLEAGTMSTNEEGTRGFPLAGRI